MSEGQYKPIPSQVEHSLKYNPVPTRETVPAVPQDSWRTRIDRTKLPAELEHYVRYTQGH